MLHALSFKVKFFVYQNVHVYSVQMFLYITALFAVFYHLKVYACVACNWDKSFPSGSACCTLPFGLYNIIVFKFTNFFGIPN
jgi:hypothetical protein